MRQETGSNTNSSKELSIQLRLDGVSFSVDGYSDCELSRPIHLLSHRTMLSPLEEFNSRGAEAVMRDGGISLTANDTIITISRDENIALIAVDSDRYSQVINTFGEDAPFTSPILRSALSDTNHIILYCNQGLTYINIYSRESMILAEVFLSPTNSDILYWLSRIDGAISLEQYRIYIANSDRSTASFLADYFPNIEVCE